MIEINHCRFFFFKPRALRTGPAITFPHTAPSSQQHKPSSQPYLGGHKGERVDATDEDAYSDRDDQHEAGQGQDRGQERDQPEMGPSRGRRREGQLGGGGETEAIFIKKSFDYREFCSQRSINQTYP